MKAGLYRHYKGGTYLVLGTAIDTGDIGRQVVVYAGARNRNFEPYMFVRTVEDFNQKLCGIYVPGDISTLGPGSTCFKPLDENERCPVHEHTNTPPVRRFEYVGDRD